jgi:hypothetical protein
VGGNRDDSRPNTGVETQDIARGFIARTLPKAKWTHYAHLRVGLWHALNYPDDISLNLLRERIRAYNESTGVLNTATAGYHETITRLYVVVIRHFVNSIDPRRPIDDLAEELIARCGERELPLRYYTRERLFSVVARLGWVEPDLQPLPEIQ